MGKDIDRETFDEGDYDRFQAALQRELETLRQLLAQPGFGEGPPSVGAELELHLVSTDPLVWGRPAPINREILRRTVNPRVALELDRFNLEINTLPEPLAGAPFSSLMRQLGRALRDVDAAAREQSACVVSTGILPTLIEVDLVGALTQLRRYRALNAGLKRIRQDAFEVSIQGAESLRVVANDVTLEGANTSLQLHLRTPPSRFVDTFNAAQIATGPLLSVCTNSPIFLGRRLWQETRVALFRQSVDGRHAVTDDDWRPGRVSFGHGYLRASPAEPFEQTVALHETLLPALQDDPPPPAGQAPALSNLLLHHGTVWHWNRAVYDHDQGGHLRVELRALPAGPTLIDMMANAALAIGLTLGLTPRVGHLMQGLTFGNARRNFYQAARFGLDAELIWPDGQRANPRVWSVRELMGELLPAAEHGLVSGGVEPAEAARLLRVIDERVRANVTGASWQAAQFVKLLEHMDREGALRELLTRYQVHSEAGVPVHEWPRP